MLEQIRLVRGVTVHTWDVEDDEDDFHSMDLEERVQVIMKAANEISEDEDSESEEDEDDGENAYYADLAYREYQQEQEELLG